MGFFMDSGYIMFVIPAMIIALFAQMNVSRAFNKYSKVYSSRGFTGYTIARRILDDNGLSHVQIQKVSGSLTDHFDPTASVVRLSDTVYNSNSVAAIGVAAHECGHAIQHGKGYLPIKIRSAIVPLTQIGSTIAWPLALMGIIFSVTPLIDLGILLFLVVVIFQLVTLPVEFNASTRALNIIKQNHILEDDELKGAGAMLRAAALTYVAALLVAVANLLRLVLLRGRRD